MSFGDDPTNLPEPSATDLFLASQQSIIRMLGQLLQGQATIISLLQKGNTMASALDTAVQNLAGEVTQDKTVEDSAVTLLQGVANQIAAISSQLANEGADTTQLNALQTALVTERNTLAAAVVANTPAAPAEKK